MRVLWFSVTPAGFNPATNAHNGGGWIASLEAIVKDRLPEVELAVAFRFPGDEKVHVDDRVTYYTISRHGVERYRRIIDLFKPDIIQIFGSENEFGAICSITQAPVVIHMQGCLPPYHNALFPAGMSKWDFVSVKGLTWRRRLMGLLSERGFRRRAEREVATIKACRYFMGRTAWDRGLIDLFNPAARYFHCEEALRDSFINSSAAWKGNIRPDGHNELISVISGPWYKGVDLILKTARLLREHTTLDYEWKVYGVGDIRFFEHKYGIKAADVGVKIMGTASKDELVEALCDASLYIHPSYIDNSPNSLCEAQYLGLPVLATHVGGIPSLVEDGVTGLLFPANGPFDLAAMIKQMVACPEEARRLGAAARSHAVKRHDPRSIAAALMNAYNSILNGTGN